MRLQTMLIYLEIHFLSKLTTELQLWESNQIDGKVTQTTLDQPSFQLLKMLPKLKLGHQLLPKPIQMRLSGQLETTTKMRTMQTFLEIHFLSKISMALLL
jgi:hypothetical protein